MVSIIEVVDGTGAAAAGAGARVLLLPIEKLKPVEDAGAGAAADAGLAKENVFVLLVAPATDPKEKETGAGEFVTEGKSGLLLLLSEALVSFDASAGDEVLLLLFRLTMVFITFDMTIYMSSRGSASFTTSLNRVTMVCNSSLSADFMGDNEGAADAL